MLRRRAAATAAALLALSACTGQQPLPPDGSTPPSTATTTATTATTTPLTPVSDPGLVTGPGVGDTTLSLGLLVDPEQDRGFTTGLTLWQRTVNAAGGVCGRSVEFVRPVGAIDETAYRTVARQTLGLVTLPAAGFRGTLRELVAGDRLPALTPEGGPADLRVPGGPVVLGATDDVLAINTAAHWQGAGVLPAGSTVGVLVDVRDGDTDALDAVTALGWWAARSGVTLQVLHPGEEIPEQVRAVYAPGAAAGVAELLTTLQDGPGLAAPATTPGPATTTTPLVSTPQPTASSGTPTSAAPTTGPTGGSTPSTTRAATDGVAVATDLDGVPTLAAADGRLLVASVTPAYAAQHPVADALRAAFATVGSSPGPRSFEGYATGEAWGRALDPMCTARTLTRAAALEQFATLGPAGADSIIGPTQPSDQITSGTPNSRVSALSVVDDRTPTGLAALTLLESAPDIGQYPPG